MKPKRKVFVFDLDDTILLGTEHDYSEPILELCRIIISELGHFAPNVPFIVRLQDKIDRKRRFEINPDTGRAFLYSTERFPGSLVKTYREICKKINKEPNSKTEDKIYQTGLKAFDEERYRKNIHVNALEILRFLHINGDRLVLLTKGDKKIQEQKIKILSQAGINFFDFIQIVEYKCEETFLNITALFRKDYSFYSVGNSYMSDIEPAIREGYLGILIPLETWEEKNETKPIIDIERCTVISHLTDIVKIYENL